MEKVSVVVLTYNGEQYIEEQLNSIINQTRKVDEIIISDDGSKDKTIQIAKELSNLEIAKGIDFVFLRDNPRHGIGGNADWAIQHTSGDIIFMSAQDDIWVADKVERILKVFNEHSDALLVSHNARIIDGKGSMRNSSFIQETNEKFTVGNCKKGESVKLSNDLLEHIISCIIVPGCAFCLRKEFVARLSPIPSYAEDQWIEFMAILYDGYYFTNQELLYYRKHDSNTSGTRSKGIKRIARFFELLKVKKSYKLSYLYFYEIGSGFVDNLTKMNMENTGAYRTALRVFEIGEKKKKALERGKIIGGLLLIRMYMKDIRYRKSGFWAFLKDYIFVIKYGEKKAGK